MKRRGFTLIELLIVFIIIGILAAAMLLAGHGSEDSAKATAILNDLRVMKSGAYLFVMSSDDFMPVPTVNYAEFLGKYMEHGRIINDPPRYAFYADFAGSRLWVGVKVSENTGKVNSILEAKATNSSTMPLYGSNDINTPPPDFSEASAYKSTHAVIWTNAR